MARQTAVSVENNFIGGLVTEKTALQFAPNSCTETWNCIHDETGRTTRRKGLNYEPDFVLEQVPLTTNEASVEFVWEGVAGLGTLNLIVIQKGKYLYFYKQSDSTDSTISSRMESYSLDFSTFKASGNSNDVSLSTCSFTSIGGNLIVVHKDCNPFYIQYDTSSLTISYAAIPIKVRDFKGVDDGLVNSDRLIANVSTLTSTYPKRYYNLLNQGWGTGGYLSEWDTARTDLPSNVDVWWHYEGTTDPFDTSLIPSTSIGNGDAPKGTYVLDYFDKNTSRNAIVSGVSSSVFDATTNRPSTVAAFGGRVFYGGINSTGFNNKIVFSQLVLSTSDLGKCYQLNDPTSRDLAELLVTDGGEIVIPEVANVIKLLTFREYLLVFASNGVWAISGSSGKGFVANDYQVNKISTSSSVSSLSFVQSFVSPLWFSDEGISTIQYNPDYGSLSVSSITNNTIKSFIDSIPSANRKYIKGCYDTDNNIIMWLFNNNSSLPTEDRYSYNRALCYNSLSKAFYPWTISEDDNVRVRGIINLKSPENHFNSVIKFITTENIDSTNDYLTFSEASDTTYVDWSDGPNTESDYSSYFITAYMLSSETQRFFQPNYVFVFQEQEDNSSCYLQAIFDYTNSNFSNRWSVKQQTYLSTPYSDVVFRRLKVRGKGRCLQLRFESSSGSPFNIIGWSVYQTGNASV